MIYEHVDGVIYQRQFNEDISQRQEIARSEQRQRLDQALQEQQLWHDIRQTAKANPALQEALDRVVVIYNLIKQQT